MSGKSNLVMDLASVRMSDVGCVGGKNASLGEMISQLGGSGVRVPGGFATTAEAYREFLAHDGLAQRIAAHLVKLDIEDVQALAQAGREIRGWIVAQPFPDDLERAIAEAYQSLVAGQSGELSFGCAPRQLRKNCPMRRLPGSRKRISTCMGWRTCSRRSSTCSHRSTTTAPSRTACTRVHAREVALSAAVQRMDAATWCKRRHVPRWTRVRDSTRSFLSLRLRLGETVVQARSPRRILCLQARIERKPQGDLRARPGFQGGEDDLRRQRRRAARWQTVPVPDGAAALFHHRCEVEELARYALIIEKHYQRPMDIESGKDGNRRAAVRAAGTTGNREGRERIDTCAATASRALGSAGHRRAIGQRIGNGRCASS